MKGPWFPPEGGSEKKKERPKVRAPWHEVIEDLFRRRPPAGWPRPGEEPGRRGGKI